MRPHELATWNEKAQTVLSGAGKAGLNATSSFLARSAVPAMSRWDGGRGDLG